MILKLPPEQEQQVRALIPTCCNREDFISAAEGCRTVEQMLRFLIRLGYEVDFPGPKWKMKLPQYTYFTHIETLNPKWTPEFVKARMGSRTHYGLVRPIVSASPYLPEELRGTWQPGIKTTHIYRLYIWWQYQLGVLPKGTSYKPTSPFMKEELRKLDQCRKMSLQRQQPRPWFQGRQEWRLF